MESCGNDAPELTSMDSKCSLRVGNVPVFFD